MNRTKHVIYRSRGCRNCRARKVKCDQARPICLKCTKARLQCQGYAEPTTFLIENPQTQGSSPASLPVSRHPSPAALEGSAWLAEPRSLPFPSESRHIAFLVRKLSIGTPGDGKGFSWLSYGLTMTDENNILHSSSRCLAEIFYGQHFQLQSTVTDGMSKYGKILQHLAQEMKEVTGKRKSDLILVIMTCLITESIVPPSTGRLQLLSGVHVHAAGLSQLIGAGGPQPLRLRRDVMIFEFCRAYVVAVAIVKRHHTFFAETQWKSVPWMYLKKNSFSELWDILCDVPSLLSDLERRKVISITWPTLEFMAPPGSAADLSARLTLLLQNLFTWRWHWERQCSGIAEHIFVNASETLIPHNSHDPQQATLIRFTDDSRVKEIIYYNATLMLLLRVGQGVVGESLLYGVNPVAPLDLPQPVQQSVLLLPTEIQSVEDATFEFCRSIEGHLYARKEPVNDAILLSFSLSLAFLGTTQGSWDAVTVKELQKKVVKASGFTLWSNLQKKN